MKLKRWAVWSNSAQQFDKKSYFFYSNAVRRKMQIAKSQAYNLGAAQHIDKIPGFIKMDLVVVSLINPRWSE